MAFASDSTPTPAPQRASHPADAATAAVLTRLPVPFVFRPCASAADSRTSDKLRAEIRTITEGQSDAAR